MRTVVLYARSPEWRAVVERADELMASPEFRVLKSEARTRAGFIDVPGAGAAFIKRVEASSWSRGLYSRLRGSRARRSLAGAAMLDAHGFAHPEPLAAMDSYRSGAIRASYLVSRALTNADSLSRFMLGPGEIKGRNVHRRKQISDAVAAQIRRLHESGLYTRDLQETNIMVEQNESGGFKVYFIDLEDFRSATTVSWDRRVLNLVHLDRSIGRFLCRAARLDFLYSYLGRRPERATARKMIAEVKATRESIDRRKRSTVPATERVAAPLGRRNPVVPFSIRVREYDHHTEQVHAAGGSWVRDVMLGLNDGLVASFAVTSGVAGAFVTGNAAMMAGLSEMLGGAVAMALAAFISARSQVEFYQSEVGREREEIRRWPEREREEISTIYRKKGFVGPLLDQIVAHITSDPERWSNVMMREELGFNEESFDNPVRSAFAVGLSYLSGAAVPVWAYIFFEPGRALQVSAISTVVVLFAVGALKTIITSRSWWRSGLESMLVGVAAAGATYVAGRMFASR